MWQNKTTHNGILQDLNSGSSSCSTGVGSPCLTADPSHRNPIWKKCVSPFFTISQCPVYFQSLGSPRWLCSLHHGCLFPITAEITTMFMTHRRHSRQINSLHISAKRLREHRYIIILPTVTSINLYRRVIIWPFQLIVFPGFPTLL